MDEEFLDNVMGTDHGVGKVDDFIGQLWTGWKQLRDEGLAQVSTSSAWLSNALMLETLSLFILAFFARTIFSIPPKANRCP